MYGSHCVEKSNSVIIDLDPLTLTFKTKSL